MKFLLVIAACCTLVGAQESTQPIGVAYDHYHPSIWILFSDALYCSRDRGRTWEFVCDPRTIPVRSKATVDSAEVARLRVETKKKIALQKGLIEQP